MNNKILVITVLLLTFAFISIPVMGAPATKKTVTVADNITRAVDPPRMVDHGISHIRGTSSGWFNLTIQGQAEPQNFTWAGEWAARVKGLPAPNPDGWGLIRGEVLLTFYGAGKTGTFEGRVHKRTKGLPNTYICSYMVLHGTGDFLGQTLKISFEGVPPEVGSGYLIMPQ